MLDAIGGTIGYPRGRFLFFWREPDWRYRRRLMAYLRLKDLLDF